MAIQMGRKRMNPTQTVYVHARFSHATTGTARF
jgi:hypothetical protein